VRLPVVRAATVVTGKDPGEWEVMGRTTWLTCSRVAPGPFDRLASLPKVFDLPGGFVYTLRGQFIVLALMVDHFAVVEAVAQHIPYAGLSKGPPIYGPTLLSVTVSPITAELEGGQVSMSIDVQDATGVSSALVYWRNPAGFHATISCDTFVNGSCTSTRTMGQSGFTISGDYEWLMIILTDTNSVYRNYHSNGTWSQQLSVTGSHGFSVSDLTVQ